MLPAHPLLIRVLAVTHHAAAERGHAHSRALSTSCWRAREEILWWRVSGSAQMAIEVIFDAFLRMNRWGGYALYLFDHQNSRDAFVAAAQMALEGKKAQRIAVEPYLRHMQ